jgi:hypothetical protein
MSNPNSIVHYGIETEQKSIDQAIAKNQWVGAANNTKWSELVKVIQDFENWRPHYRTCWLTNSFISHWDCEWFAHLPYPFSGVLWLDLNTLQHTKGEKFPLHHSARLQDLLCKIGLEFEQRADIIRIWGYLPKDETDFPPQTNFIPQNPIFSDTWK